VSDYPVAPINLKLKTTAKERRLEYEEQLAEKEYQLSRLEAEEKRFIDGHMKKIERDKIRLKREIAELTKQKDDLDALDEQEIIDVTQTEGGQNG
jgi:hypothetical protein